MAKKRRSSTTLLRGRITRDRTLDQATTWLVVGEVRVARGVTLKVEDGTTILIANGVAPGSRLRRSALIFEAGSALAAGRLAVRACGANHRPVRQADNGGLWFLGTFSSGSKDGIAVKKGRGRGSTTTTSGATRSRAGFRPTRSSTRSRPTDRRPGQSCRHDITHAAAHDRHQCGRRSPRPRNTPPTS